MRFDTQGQHNVIDEHNWWPRTGNAGIDVIAMNDAGRVAGVPQACVRHSSVDVPDTIYYRRGRERLGYAAR